MSELYHHGIQGQKWGVRRYQNADGSLTPEGRERYGSLSSDERLNKVSRQQTKELLNYYRRNGVRSRNETVEKYIYKPLSPISFASSGEQIRARADMLSKSDLVDAKSVKKFLKEKGYIDKNGFLTEDEHTKRVWKEIGKSVALLTTGPLGAVGILGGTIAKDNQVFEEYEQWVSGQKK